MGIWKKLLLAFGSLTFTLFLAEGVLRFFPLLRPQPRTYVGDHDRPATRPWLIADPLLGWKLRPSAPVINAQGFRAPFDFHPHPDCKEIAFVGDSFTFGVGVGFQKTFASLTQASLPGSCAYNMGVPGFGLDQIWLTVRTQALPLHPRLIVVAFVTDDLRRSEEASNGGFGPKPAFKLAKGRLVPKTTNDHPTFLIRFLQHNSSLWRLVQLADRTLASRYPHGEWWNLNAAVLDAIQDDCRGAGVPVLFVYIPTDGWRQFPSLRAYMFRKGANFVDLSQGQFVLTSDMYIPRDRHLNERGHQQVADALLSWLQHGPPYVSAEFRTR